MELQDIISSVDIVEYIQQYLDLEEQSNGEYTCLCPFHNEKTPSFTITPSTQCYYCFGCYAGGNVLSFIQRYHKLNIHQAIENLKEYANITDETKITSLTATRIIKKFKQPYLSKPVHQRQVLSKDVMSRYESDVSKLQIWIDEGISFDILQRRQVKYDPFSNRIVFPIMDNDGNIISIKGRTLYDNYKELKISKYTYFRNSDGKSVGDVDFIYGYCDNFVDYIFQKEIILFEGEKSVMKAESWGINNVGALLTSKLNDHQLRILIKLGVNIVFALDKEVNVREDKNIMKLRRFNRVFYIQDKENLLDTKDAPVDKGLEVWKKLYERKMVLK